MHRIQTIVLLIAAFFLFSSNPAIMAADTKPAPTAEQLQAEYAQIQVQYQLVQSQRENLAYRERDMLAKAKEIQEKLKTLEAKKAEKKEVKK